MTLLGYTPPATGRRFMLSEAPFRMIMGPVGSGKSTGCCVEMGRRAAAQAKDPRTGLRMTRWAVIRNTKQQLKDTTLKTWLQWYPDGVAGTWKESDMTYTMRFGDVVAEVLFRALDDPQDVNRLLSLELTGAYINEARELPLPIVTALRSRLGRYPSRKDGGPTWHGLIGDTNPPDMDHWIYEQFETERTAGWEIFKQPGGLSPEAENTENLPPNYYEDMMSGATQAWIDVHVHARYGRSKAGRPVYEHTFVRDFHVAKDSLIVVKSAPIMLGMDFGRTPACTFEQVLPGGRFVIHDEVWDDNSGLERFIRTKVKPKLAERFAGLRVIVCGDPAGWDKSQINDLSCADILKQEKLSAMRAPTNALNKRLESVEHQLGLQVDGRGALQIDPRCRRLIAGFEGGYHYKAVRGGYQATPDKNEFSHIHDGRQYAALCADRANDMATQLTTRRVLERVDSRGWT